MNLEEPSYTPSQIARKLGVHISSAWRWMLTGVKGRKLSSRLVGGRRKIFERDLEAFLAIREDNRMDASQAPHPRSPGQVEAELQQILGPSTTSEREGGKSSSLSN